MSHGGDGKKQSQTSGYLNDNTQISLQRLEAGDLGLSRADEGQYSTEIKRDPSHDLPEPDATIAVQKEILVSSIKRDI